MYKIVKKIFDFITLIILTVSLIGAFGIITAPSLRQADDIKQLENCYIEYFIFLGFFTITFNIHIVFLKKIIYTFFCLCSICNST